MVFLHKKIHFTTFQIIIAGFAFIILLGALLLMLPISSRNGVTTPFNEALFTSASAVCVTGLVVQDTAAYWSLFGQTIILLLIQIGGMGVTTVAIAIALISRRKISLIHRSTMQDAIGAPKVGGIVRFTSFFIKGTLLIEFTGALILMPVFCRDFGAKGIWISLFHAISAFCNAGFDLLGTAGSPFVSLTAYRGNLLINIVIPLLIVIGGIGFFTWDDICRNRRHFKRYRMQSKVILVTTLILILVPLLFFYCFEYTGEPLKERILYSLFQAITPRTAGFNTTDLTALSSGGKCIMMILMLIGGSPGSTAGGMKTTTIAVLFANSAAVFRRNGDSHFFGRRTDEDAAKNASTILMMYLTLFLSGGLVMSMVEKLPLETCLFETASALGTVGLTLGITPGLGILSQGMLVLLMFFGRVGGLTLIYATFSKAGTSFSRLPKESIAVG